MRGRLIPVLFGFVGEGSLTSLLRNVKIVQTGVSAGQTGDSVTVKGEERDFRRKGGVDEF